MTSLELVAQMRERWVSRTRVRTHFVGCDQYHADCAIERLCQEIDRLTTSRCRICDEACSHGSESVE